MKSNIQNRRGRPRMIRRQATMSSISFSFYPFPVEQSFGSLRKRQHRCTATTFFRRGFESFSIEIAPSRLPTGVHGRELLARELGGRCLRTKAGRSPGDQAHGDGGFKIEGVELQESPQNEQDSPSVAAKSASQGSSILSILCPLLKLLGGGDPSLPRNDFFEVATSGLATISRLPWGSQALPHAAAMCKDKEQSFKPLQLYEFEACPFCRRVREAMTELDLSAEVYPCPKGSVKHREQVRRSGGKEQFPYLVDPNTGVALYESGDIVKYLFKQYGEGKDPSPGLLESTLFTGWIPTIVRAGRGMTLWERAKPELATKKLELFSYENNQYARIVREALCELELPYILHNVGKGSSKIEMLFQLAGSNKVPLLIDPNTGVCLDSRTKILSYLFQTYCNTR